jgi:hypothetical protein
MQPDRPKSLKTRAAEFVGHTAESSAACAVVMVQGQILVLSAAHWLIALQTGLLAGVVSTVLVAIGRATRPWVLSVVLGGATALADFIVHSGDFIDVFTEAIVTGVGAAAICYVVTLLLRSLRRRWQASLARRSAAPPHQSG